MGCFPGIIPNAGSIGLACFASAKDAENFCRPSEYEQNSAYKTRSFRYTPIEPILKQLLSEGKTPPVSAANRMALQQEMEDHPIGPGDGQPIEPWMDSIARGDLNTVTYKRTFIPKDKIHEYHLYRHLYPRGTVYEAGHGRLPFGSYPRHDVAIEQMQRHLHNPAPIDRVSELVLVGQFKDVQLRLDYDCLPERGTGLVISTESLPFVDPDHAERRTIDPMRPYTAENHLFARLDPETQRLRSYDDRLQQLDPSRSHFDLDIRSFTSSHELIPSGSNRSTSLAGHLAAFDKEVAAQAHRQQHGEDVQDKRSRRIW